MQVKDVANSIEQFAPLHFQESYDNAGLCIGNPDSEVSGILLTVDVTETVIDEALALKCNLIISHHPLLFKGIKRITGQGTVERCILKAIQHELSIYSAHTNIDAVDNGVNRKICEKLGLRNCTILSPTKGELKKLVTYVPNDHSEAVREALFKAGAGKIGNYDNCSFNSTGTGTYKGNDFTRPFKGEKNIMHAEPETRIETIFLKHLQGKIIKALLENHPYEEVAYDIYSLDNLYEKAGAGMIGDLPDKMDELLVLMKIKNTFSVHNIRHTQLRGKPVQKIAVCGGSGSFLLDEAIRQNADFFISSDFKYHQFFDAEGKIVIADIGHYESEQFTKEIFYDLLIKNFPKFAVHFSSIVTNPINYF
jgi:dinuclear metal center YbgI/SA1388 family protein